MTFQQIYDQRPDPSNFGGSGYSRMKNLYDMCMRIRPEVIIESGTWKGNSSWVFRNACPDAKIYCYDIDFSNLKWRDKSIQYHEYDITNHTALWGNLDLSKTLIFFDDHVSHLERLYWANEHGFKHLLFDDNFSYEQCKHLKNPPTPTLKMLNDDTLPKSCIYEILPFHGRDLETYLTYIKITS